MKSRINKYFYASLMIVTITNTTALAYTVNDFSLLKTESGICWNMMGTPTIATNYAGTGYGEEVNFTTLAASPDSVRIVAKDGSGNYTSINAAFNAVPSNYSGKWTIYVKKGIYNESVTLAAAKTNVVLIGEDRDGTIIISDKKPGFTRTGPTCTINANNFTAINLTFNNSSPAEKALSLMTNGDRIAFYNCKILGRQDTYCGNSLGRAYFKKCFIEGTVDFIYGRAIMVFDSCTIHMIRDGGYITAASTEISEKFGINFLDCTITNDPLDFQGKPFTGYYLGRPWHNYPRVVYIRCYESGYIKPAGWTTMYVYPFLYAEYNCSGPGFKPSSRTTMWGNAVRTLTDSEAATYTISNIFSEYSIDPPFASNWIPESSYDTTGVENSK
jgi:pectin methylesterase-like acyl-CoA thioesterase